MNVFPDILLRITGKPFDDFQSLNLTKTISGIEKIVNLKHEVNNLKDQIADYLFQAIPEVREPKFQNILLNLRRDIFNQRKVDLKIINTLEPYLSNCVKGHLEKYHSITLQIQDLYIKSEKQYSKETACSREQLRILAKEELFQKGLLLSSQSLLDRTCRYLSKDTVSPRKKDFQTEKSLIKYLSRMHTKTSPFSTFTHLSVLSLNPQKGGISLQDLFSPFTKMTHLKTTHHIRLNNFLYQYLKGLLIACPDISQNLKLRTNPTLKKEDNYYLFLTNSNNVEAFQRIPHDPVLDVFLTIVSEKKEGLTSKNLVHTIIEDEYIDAPAEELHAYIYQLLEYGFFEYHFGVSGIDPDWDIKLRKKSTPDFFNHPGMKDVFGSLSLLRQSAEEYGKSSISRRRAILKESFPQFREMCMGLQKSRKRNTHQIKTT
jgi:hypothetical protein